MSQINHAETGDSNAEEPQATNGEAPKHNGGALSDQNSWLVDEMYQQFLENPKLVDEKWREVFTAAKSGDNQNPFVSASTLPAQAAKPAAATATTENGAARGENAAAATTGSDTASATGNGATPQTGDASAQASPAAATPEPNKPATKSTPAAAATKRLPAAPKDKKAAKSNTSSDTATPEPKPIRGVGAIIVENMEASLGVPTATSFREIPARLLEINRKVLNNSLARVRGGKVSFTHLIGYAIIRSIVTDVPNFKNTYGVSEDGKGLLFENPHINLGIAVDMKKKDGSRTLMVPVIKNCEQMNFREFVEAYEAVITKVRANKIAVDDLMGANITLTNPGTIGTVQSVPRLMPGQAAIIGAGRIGFPAQFEGADPALIAQLGLSKTVTITSTYDHRIIQGAESGFFLKKIHELLLGEDDFYTDVFSAMGVPYEAVKWRVDHGAAPSSNNDNDASKQFAVNTLISQYRVRGHLIANTNPLADKAAEMHPELDPASYGLTIWDLDREFLTGNKDGVFGPIGGKEQKMPLGDILGVLRDAYCRTIGIEYMHTDDTEGKRWIQENVEGTSLSFEHSDQRHILDRLNAAVALEKFLATRYVGQKRFGLEGAESAIPVLDTLLSAAADANKSRAILGMAHRGRLNVLVNIMGKDYEDLFNEFEGNVDGDAVQGTGDVKYHLGLQGVHTSREGNTIDIELAANPSHLEAVDPVVVGMARAHMDQEDNNDYPIVPILIHGDAAFAGQGVVFETLNLSEVSGYRVGGTVHLVINNQLGYTTAPHNSRSSQYSTDIAKAVQAPIFHVNADDPEACVYVAQLAFAYRDQFNKDVVIDMIGYRRHGHNEGDDPSYTQPMMYRKIADRPSVRDIYTEDLLERGDLTQEEAEEALESFQAILQRALDKTRDASGEGHIAKPAPPPIGVLPHVETGVDRSGLDAVYADLSKTPEDFVVHPKLAKQFVKRDEMWASGEVDWALGEAFALGSLLKDGVDVRLTGQDSRRGTFAHRHATLFDYETGKQYTPLKYTSDSKFWIYDSTLSEYAALGFEYGYSFANPNALVIWEAQFGDFINGSQIIIDQFLVAAEDKWNQYVNLVMLLPHGYEGQGPEHSSARLERFLLLCAEDNIQIANVTTAAQFFHLLRRQIVQESSKPLVVFTPKSGLRAKSYRSPVSDLTSGSFEEVLDDSTTENPADIKRVIFASGKISNEAIEYREQNGISGAAIVKVEQLYPWPFEDVAAALSRYSRATEIVWLQEEPENMGAWNAIKGRLYERHEKTHTILRVSRYESGSPATGSQAIHKQEQAELLGKAFDGMN